MARNRTTIGTAKRKNTKKQEDESGMFIIVIFIVFKTPIVFAFLIIHVSMHVSYIGLDHNKYVSNFSTLVNQQLKLKKKI